MLQQPKISIVIPVYNVENYIQETIDSILNQTMGVHHFEVIFINDGSTDDSHQIIDKYISEYENFKAIHCLESSGAAGKPRNIGIKQARGKYVLFADPDDVFLPDACTTLYRFAEEHESEIVIGTFSSFSEYDENDKLFESFDCKLMVNKTVEEHPFFVQIPNNLGAKLYRTELIKANNILFPEGVASQDAYFTTKAYLMAEKISFIPKNIFKYRIRTSSETPSITQNRNLKYFQDFSVIRTMLIQLYREYPRLDYFEVRYLNDLRWLFYQLEYVNNVSAHEKIQIIQTVYWFVVLAEQYGIDVDFLTPNRRELFNKILINDYEGAITHMNGQLHTLFKNI
ncbi:glycosyltransferase family 2 protein [Priestia megaterium]|uniref:glycosyltransferase family 2 protein n=1 Tax=Priestia megaterium TaxID=1404 RepID=UPI0015E2D3C2|nr:glycosyltransferase [Priestia megaterium]